MGNEPEDTSQETLKIDSSDIDSNADGAVYTPASVPDDTNRMWVFFAVVALGLIAFGLILFAWPRETTLVLSVVVGVALIFFGVLEAGTAIIQRDESLWGWFLFRGIVTAALGVVLLAWPGRTILVVAIVFGIYLIFTGVLEIMFAIAIPETENRWLYLLLGVLAIVLGVVVIAEIRDSPVLGIIFGTFVIFFGALQFVSAIALRERDDLDESADW